ncbi:MAG TPA: carbohydrate binding domain-containing protein, partial [Armatimonadota bacterium]|nr:carbohydrate binding domain-containing protein [Armatimonadota bacterium]
MQILRILCMCCLLATCIAGTAVYGEPSTNGQPTTMFPFVLPWDDATSGITNVSGLFSHPSGKDGFLIVKNGHFFAGNNRVRLFGVNVCFGSCFPSHEEAEKVAARMAKFGINCVRFHQMDNQVTPNGIFAKDKVALDPEQLEKLDYFIAQLKKNGIYADLNLHVTRLYPDLPTATSRGDKGVDNFHPRMIEWQKTYAHDLLTHMNPYTNHRYTDEPAIAFVEISNENSLSRSWGNGDLDGLPGLYADELNRQWHSWLRKRYPTIDAIRTAWHMQEIPLGKEMLVNGDFSNGQNRWTLEQHGPTKATATVTNDGPDGKPALCIKVEQNSAETWHLQFHQAGLVVKQDQPYTLSFWAKADAACQVGLDMLQAHDPWQKLWFSSLRLTPQWRQYTYTTLPGLDEQNARVTFTSLGMRKGATYYITNISLRPGNQASSELKDQLQSFDTIPYLEMINFRSYPTAAQQDWARFVWETERAYWTGMQAYLKNELHTRSLIFGTQTEFSPALLQADMDVMGINTYWQHPSFPSRPWDAEDWFVTNVSMAGDRNGGILSHMAFQRIEGKPFVVTEYNHSAPNTYSSEGSLLMSAFASMQDWDGIFVYAYNYRNNNWDARRMTNILEIDQHPTKMATLPAAAALFLRGDVPPTQNREIIPVSTEMAIETLRRLGATAPAFGLTSPAGMLPFKRTISLKIANEAKPVKLTAPSPDGTAYRSDNNAFCWDPQDGHGVATVDTYRSKMVVGYCSTKVFDLHGVTVAPLANMQNWAAISLTVMDGQNFNSHSRILVTATGNVENTGMVWKNPEKSSVGRNWGKAPSLVEGIPATISLPVAANRVQAWALDELG